MSGVRIDRETLRALYATGLSDAAIAKRAGCSASTVYKWRCDEGLPAIERLKFDDDVARQLYDQGATDRQIEVTLNVSSMTVFRWRNRHGLSCNRSRNSRIDPAKARALHAEGKSDSAIARACRVSRQTVFRWREREGLAPAAAGNASCLDWKRAAELHGAGASVLDIIEALGCSSVSVYKWLRDTGRKPNRPKKVKSVAVAEPAAGPRPAPVRRLAVPRAPEPKPVPCKAVAAVPGPCAARPVANRPDGFCADRDAALATTGGRYADLWALAERWGMRFQRVQARYHVVARATVGVLDYA